MEVAMEGLFCAQEEDGLKFRLITDICLDYLVKGTQIPLRDEFLARARSGELKTIQLRAQPITKGFIGRRTPFFRTFSLCSKVQLQNEKREKKPYGRRFEATQ